MSSSDSQPPLTRRQARERERAAETGGQPVTPDAAVPAGVPASVASAGEASRSAGTTSRPGSPAVPTDMPRRRPGSHVAPAAAAPAQGPAVPAAAVQPASSSDEQPPASATEIVPGTGMTRRQLRALRDAEHRDQDRPVPLQAPSPQSSDRTVADVLGDVAALEGQRFVTEHPEPEPDRSAFTQATEADGSPDAIEPLAEAAAHSDEPRMHRSTWAPPSAEADAPLPEAEPVVDVVPAAPGGDSAAAGATDDADAGGAPRSAAGGTAVPSASAATVFPLDLAGDASASEDTSAPDGASSSDRASASDGASSSDRASASAGGHQEGRHDDDAAVAGSRSASDLGSVSAPGPSDTPGPRRTAPTVPGPATPTGHWSRQVDAEDDHVHDHATGEVRATQTQTNALILPNSALSDVTGALNATGEVIITGSIDLPKALAATGAHTTQIDGAEIDRLLEQHDAETATNDAEPVRASRAVSSHTSTRAVVLAAAKPKQSRVPTVLAVSAAGVGIAGVIAVVIAVFSLGHV